MAELLLFLYFTHRPNTVIMKMEYPMITTTSFVKKVYGCNSHRCKTLLTNGDFYPECINPKVGKKALCSSRGAIGVQ